MAARRAISLLFPAVVVVVLAALGTMTVLRLSRGTGGPPAREGTPPAPVEVVPVTRGSIEDRRVFSGTLEATALVVIAPKVAGRLASIPVDLGDGVERGQVVATLEDDELRFAVAEAEAEVAVAEAGIDEMRSAAEAASRSLERVQELHRAKDASDADLDAAEAEHAASAAAVEAARARATRARAALESARVRLSYATIRANWEGGDGVRVVAERFAEEGEVVSANTPLLSILELDPIQAVMYATERDYASFAVGQGVSLTTDAFPGRSWEGRVSRIAPIFSEGSRQARVEVVVANAEGALKPGMFARIETVLGVAPDAVIVPVEALAERGGRTVVFLTDAAGETVRMVPVEIGIRAGGRVQVLGADLVGRVVTLGQQLLEDGSRIKIPEAPAAAERGVN